MVTTTGSTCIGSNSNTSFNYSTAIGSNAVCTGEHQIMLGTVQESVVVPANLSVTGTINNISNTVFGYLSNVSSDVQNQLNTIKQTTTDIQWIQGTINRTSIGNACSTEILTFSNSLNGISTSTFSFLSGLTGNIQNQINNINNANPPGSVIQYAGSSAYLSGYLKCDGNLYSISSYYNLYNSIGTMYGGDSNLGYFNVPNYQGIFLRGAGNQTLDLQIPSNAKNYASPGLGVFVMDKSVQPYDYVNGITQTVRSFVTNANAFGPPNYNFDRSNAVASLQYTTASNNGVVETFPVHTSIQYFIKY